MLKYSALFSCFGHCAARARFSTGSVLVGPGHGLNQVSRNTSTTSTAHQYDQRDRKDAADAIRSQRGHHAAHGGGGIITKNLGKCSQARRAGRALRG